jgi:hypothetical protein
MELNKTENIYSGVERNYCGLIQVNVTSFSKAMGLNHTMILDGCFCDRVQNT